MTQDTNTASGAADLLDLIDAYAEARHRQGHSSYNAQTATALQAVKDALAAGQATAAQAVVQDDLITIRKPTTSAEMLWLLKLAHLVISDVDKTLEETFAPAQPAAQQGAAYAEMPEPLEIDWPELHSQALGCGVEDRGLHNRYECAEYGWQDGVDKCAERVPEQIFDADQLRAFADRTHALRAAHGQAPADLSPTAGMNIAQRILHVGGRNNDAGYVEFGSIQAVDALVRQVLRDLPAPAQADSVLEDAARLDWLLLRISGAEFRRLGVHYSGNARRADVDAARKQGENHGR